MRWFIARTAKLPYAGWRELSDNLERFAPSDVEGVVSNILRAMRNTVLGSPRGVEIAIRRGTFRCVKELVEKIYQYVENSNCPPHPFVWTATADSIFVKVQRLCERISGTGH